MAQRGFSNRIEQNVSLRVDPRIILSAKILELNQLELEQAIETELNENPALERINDGAEALSDESILKRIAPSELRFDRDDHELYRSVPKDGESTDWVDLASSATTLHEHLRAQMFSVLPKELSCVGLYLVEAIDDRGYLCMPIEEIALANSCSIEQAALALKYLQQCEPAGIGATSVQECLLLQLRTAETLEEKLAKAIIKNHMDDFAARKTVRIAKKYKVHPSVVEQAFQVILELTPYPAEGFDVGSAPLNQVAATVSPDIIFKRTEFGWQIEIQGVISNDLIVNRAYSERLGKLQNKSLADTHDEKKHLQTYVQRAQDFIASVESRQKTLKLLAEYLIEKQASFITTGSYRFLQPLTRAELAKAIGVHESTVSRATQDKFVQIDTGEMVAFEVFFKPALRVQKMIEEILQNENPGDPISDERIGQLLAERGVHVARRTVNKYRDATKLLSSHKRKLA